MPFAILAHASQEHLCLSQLSSYGLGAHFNLIFVFELCEVEFHRLFMDSISLGSGQYDLIALHIYQKICPV